MKSIYYLIVLMGGLLGPTQLLAAGTPKPGFDCADAATKTEKRICDSRELSLLDKDMSGFYRTLIQGHYPQAATMQKLWLEKRNNCGSSQNPDECLLDLYKKRVLALAVLHVEANLGGQPYCAKDCIYQHGYEILDMRIGENSVEYLIFDEQYSYGIVRDQYYIGVLGKDRLEPKVQICATARQDVRPVSIDKDCTSVKAREYFRAGRK